MSFWLVLMYFRYLGLAAHIGEDGVTVTRSRTAMVSVLEFRPPRASALASPAATGLWPATRGCFVKLILRKLFNQAFLFSFVIFCFVLTGTLAAQNQYYVSNSGSDSNSVAGQTMEDGAARGVGGQSGQFRHLQRKFRWYSVPNGAWCMWPRERITKISPAARLALPPRVVYISDTQWGAHLVANGCSSGRTMPTMW